MPGRVVERISVTPIRKQSLNLNPNLDRDPIVILTNQSTDEYEHDRQVPARHIGQQ